MNPGKIVRLGLYIHIIMSHPVTNNPFHTGNNIFNAQVTDPLNVPFDQSNAVRMVFSIFSENTTVPGSVNSNRYKSRSSSITR